MITSDNIAAPATDGIQFIHDPSIDRRFVVIMQPCKSILVGCNEGLQPPSSALLEGRGETLPLNRVWHLEFRTYAVNVLASFTVLHSLTCFIAPFLLHFNLVLYVTDCVSVMLSICVLINAAKTRVITSLNLYRGRIIFGNEANCTDMIYSLSAVFVFTTLLLKSPTDSSLDYSYSYRSIGYVCKFLAILFINTTSKVTTRYTRNTF